ncbi:hypothetical protein GGI35DRAFT_327062 [Trichoderma velutinum]
MAESCVNRFLRPGDGRTNNSSGKERCTIGRERLSNDFKGEYGVGRCCDPKVTKTRVLCEGCTWPVRVLRAYIEVVLVQHCVHHWRRQHPSLHTSTYSLGRRMYRLLFLMVSRRTNILQAVALYPQLEHRLHYLVGDRQPLGGSMKGDASHNSLKTGSRWSRLRLSMIDAANNTHGGRGISMPLELQGGRGEPLRSAEHHPNPHRQAHTNQQPLQYYCQGSEYQTSIERLTLSRTW